MVKVKATKASKVYNKALKEFHRIVEEGEEFEVTEERFKLLNGANKYNVAFVVPVDAKIDTPAKVTVPEPSKGAIPQGSAEPEIYVIEPGKEPVKVDADLKPIKKTRKKTTKK